MLESLCGKTKSRRPARSNTDTAENRQKIQHQRQQSFDSSSPSSLRNSSRAKFNKSISTTSSEDDPAPRSTMTSSRRSQWWLSTSSSPSADSWSTTPSQGASVEIPPPPPAPPRRSFAECRPKSITMDNLQQRRSTAFVMSSLDDALDSDQNSKHLRLPRSKTSTIPEHSSISSTASATITRQNAITSEFASLSPTFPPARPIRLTNVQRTALQNTWRIMKDNSADRISEKIFQKLISSQPKVKDVFYKAAFLTIFTRSNSITTYRDHSRLLVRLFSDLVANVDKCDGVLKEIRECGMKHVFLRNGGFKGEIWERFGEAAIEVINEQDCVKSNLEAVKAWTIVIASITDEMRHGYEKESRRQSYTFERPKSACE